MSLVAKGLLGYSVAQLEKDCGDVEELKRLIEEEQRFTELFISPTFFNGFLSGLVWGVRLVGAGVSESLRQHLEQRKERRDGN